MIYTGIGSRKTPSKILSDMVFVGGFLGTENVTLRSGGANGADSAFEQGCDNVTGPKEIFLPWENFNGKEGHYTVDKNALDLAATIHPAWHNCSPAAKKLHARNCYQVLGASLCVPSNLVICYTEDGKLQGGTATALKLAMQYNIPIMNLGDKRYIDISRDALLEEIIKKLSS